MRHEPNLHVERFRTNDPKFEDQQYGSNAGCFLIPSGLEILAVISSGNCGNGWEHVSVSRPNRCPTWAEMDKIKHLFWRDDETVIQFHPREPDKINFHQFVLHLWKKENQEHELPPADLV